MTKDLGLVVNGVVIVDCFKCRYIYFHGDGSLCVVMTTGFYHKCKTTNFLCLKFFCKGVDNSLPSSLSFRFRLSKEESPTHYNR